MLRFSVEPGERRARYSAVYALLGVGLIPLSVLAVHIAQDALPSDRVHRTAPTWTAACSSRSWWRWRRCSAWRWRCTWSRCAASGSTSGCAAAPAGRGHGVIDESAVRSVAAVYGMAWVVTLAYVVILNAKLGRLERQLDEIAGLLEARGGDG